MHLLHVALNIDDHIRFSVLSGSLRKLIEIDKVLIEFAGLKIKDVDIALLHSNEYMAVILFLFIGKE